MEKERRETKRGKGRKRERREKEKGRKGKREGRTEKERDYERLAHYVGWCEQRQQRDF